MPGLFRPIIHRRGGLAASVPTDDAGNAAFGLNASTAKQRLACWVLAGNRSWDLQLSDLRVSPGRLRVGAASRGPRPRYCRLLVLH